MSAIHQPHIQDGTDPEKHQGRITLQFYNESGAAIAEGDTVAIDVSKTTFGKGRSIKAGPASADSALILGVADKAIPNLAWGEVLVWGIKTNCNVADAVTAEAGLQQSGTAGRLEAAGGNDERRVGLALTDGDGSNRGSVFVGI